VSDEQQTQQADDPSGEGWRDVEVGEILQSSDMLSDGTRFVHTDAAGSRCTWQGVYRRRIEQQQPSDSEPETMEQLRKRLDAAVRQNVELADELEDVRRSKTAHQRIAKASVERAQEAEALLAEVERGGEQVNAELQQLREQLTTLTRERDRYRNQLAGAIEHSKAPEAQAQLVDRLQAWLRPVLEVVADHPDDTSILAVSVLEFLPQIASRLIEE
jgi:DNA repair exonuclease SbcCD ATPase subunit